MALGYTAYHTSCCRFTGVNISIPDIGAGIEINDLDNIRLLVNHFRALHPKKTQQNVAEATNDLMLIDQILHIHHTAVTV